ncbi:MAG TPA: TraR/DksA C4-type zinc finger protein [Phycisphaerae bacterium]|nr:TraR/DksA C4-type zinc finger protein [Phycisphaerae bacterium]
MAKKVKSRKTVSRGRKAAQGPSDKKKTAKPLPARSRKKTATATETVAVAETSKPRRLRKTPLGKADLKSFRAMLLEKRRALVGDMNGMEAEAFRGNRQDRSGDLSNVPIHPADIGTDNYEQEFTLGLLESERTLLREIDEALERIDQGTYGICLGTGQAIDKARLRACPWAKYCIEYARMIEKGLVKPQEESEPDELDEDNHQQGRPQPARASAQKNNSQEDEDEE